MLRRWALLAGRLGGLLGPLSCASPTHQNVRFASLTAAWPVAAGGPQRGPSPPAPQRHGRVCPVCHCCWLLAGSMRML